MRTLNVRHLVVAHRPRICEGQSADALTHLGCGRLTTPEPRPGGVRICPAIGSDPDRAAPRAVVTTRDRREYPRRTAGSTFPTAGAPRRLALLSRYLSISACVVIHDPRTFWAGILRDANRLRVALGSRPRIAAASSVPMVAPAYLCSHESRPSTVCGSPRLPEIGTTRSDPPLAAAVKRRMRQSSRSAITAGSIQRRSLPWRSISRVRIDSTLAARSA